MRVSVEGGKYTYVITETNAHVLRYGELWKDATGDKFTYSMAAEIESLREQVEKLENRLNKDSQEFTILCAKETEKVLREQLATLAVQNEKMRKVLLRLACLGNGDQYGNSIGNCIAQEALSLPDLATPVLNRIKAEAYLEAAEIAGPEDSYQDQWFKAKADSCAKLRAKADELEQQCAP